MGARRTIRKHRNETGIALLIAIFILLLIGVVAIALIVSSGTETALAGNYRSSTAVYYAAVAGLEEVRSRLRSNNPNSFSNTAPGFLPPSGTPLGACAPVYVINPVGGETVAPWDPGNAYYDSEFNTEFAGVPCSIPSSPLWTDSIWNRSPLNSLPFPGPYYKWVRINGVSEQSLNLDTYPYNGIDSNLIYYDGTQQRLNDQGTGSQVLEITALAVVPNGSQKPSQKLLQYLVAPQILDLDFPAALTLDGNPPQFTAPTSPSFWVRGYDQGSVGTCNPGSKALPAVGFTSGSFSDFVKPSNPSGIPAGPSPSPDLRDHYTNGVAASNPDIVDVFLQGTLSANLQTVAGLNALVQTIQQNADVVVNGNATQANMPTAMSPTNPMTIVVNGDLTLSGWQSTGYGLLLVTGQFTYDPHGSWDGIILVIGKGQMYSNQGSTTSTQIQGAVLLAKTVGASASSAPISPRFDFNLTPNSLTNSINYSSCWVQAAMPAMSYKILSFHEIAQ